MSQREIWADYRRGGIASGGMSVSSTSPVGFSSLLVPTEPQVRGYRFQTTQVNFASIVTPRLIGCSYGNFSELGSGMIVPPEWRQRFLGPGGRESRKLAPPKIVHDVRTNLHPRPPSQGHLRVSLCGAATFCAPIFGAATFATISQKF